MKLFGKRPLVKILLLIIILFYFYLLSNEHSCKSILEENIVPLQVNGIVIRKFINSDDHALQTIVVEQKDHKLRNIIAYDLQKYDSLYKFIQKGDSLSKKSADTTFIIKRNSQIHRFKISCD